MKTEIEFLRLILIDICHLFYKLIKTPCVIASMFGYIIFMSYVTNKSEYPFVMFICAIGFIVLGWSINILLADVYPLFLKRYWDRAKQNTKKKNV